MDTGVSRAATPASSACSLTGLVRGARGCPPGTSYREGLGSWAQDGGALASRAWTVCSALSEVCGGQRHPGQGWGRNASCRHTDHRGQGRPAAAPAGARPAERAPSPLCSPSCHLPRGCEVPRGMTGGELAEGPSALAVLGRAPGVGGWVAAGVGLGGHPAEPLRAAGAGAHLLLLAVSFCPREQISPKGRLWGGASHIAPGQSVRFLWAWGPDEGPRPRSGQQGPGAVQASLALSARVACSGCE